MTLTLEETEKLTDISNYLKRDLGKYDPEQEKGKHDKLQKMIENLDKIINDN